MNGLINNIESTDWLKAFGVGQAGVVNVPALEKLLGNSGGGYGQTGEQPINDIVMAAPRLATLPTVDRQLLSGGTLSTGQVHTLTNPAFGNPESAHWFKPYWPYIVAGIGTLIAVLAIRGR